MSDISSQENEAEQTLGGGGGWGARFRYTTVSGTHIF